MVFFRWLNSSTIHAIRHHVRLVLAGVDVHDRGQDFAEGAARQARHKRTLQRTGEPPDPTLKDVLIGDMVRNDAIAELNSAEFSRERLEGQAHTDPVALCIDEGLVPKRGDVPVSDRQNLLRAFQAGCANTNHNHTGRSTNEHNLIDQIRKVLPISHSLGPP